jgi:hypothetical protein
MRLARLAVSVSLVLLISVVLWAGVTVGSSDVPWTARHQASDLTIRFVVTPPLNATSTYEWFLADGTRIGEGSIIDYTFELSGIYTVILRTTTAEGNVTETPGEVEAKSVSFMGQWAPVLLLTLLAVWYVVSILATIPSDAGRLAESVVMVILFALAIQLAGRPEPLRTFDLGGGIAVQAYGGVMAMATATIVRHRLLALGLFVVGVILLVLTYATLGAF